MPKHRYISLLRNSYMIKVGTKYIGTRKTIEEAIKLRDEYCSKNNIKIPEDKR